MEDMINPYDEEIKEIPDEIKEQYWNEWLEATDMSLDFTNEYTEEDAKEFFYDEILPMILESTDEFN